MQLIRRFIGLIALSVAMLECAPPPKVVQTAADKEVLNSMLQQVEKHAGDYTQSEAYLSVKPLRNLVAVTPGLEKNRKIIQAAMAKEREFNDDYYVFYTAIPHLRLFQDVTRKLYKRKFGSVGALRHGEFQFLRYTHKDPAYDQYKNATDFLTKEITENGIIDDNEPHLKSHLISTNLAFFGNIQSTGESTWYFFNNPQPWVYISPDWMRACLKSFGYPEVYAAKLITLAPLATYDQGELFQIFVPKNLVDTIGYVSWRLGIPYDLGILTSWFGRTSLEVRSWILHGEIRERAYNLRRQWRSGTESVKDQVVRMLDRVSTGAYALAPLLNEYKLSGPQNIDDMQARLLVTNSGLLNPQSGIKIYRYSNLPASKLEEYKKKLKVMMLEMDAYTRRIRK